MSNRLRKIGIKNQLREALMKLQGVGMYFNEYKLNKHFLQYVKAKNEGTELPARLKFDESFDNNTSTQPVQEGSKADS